MNVRRTPALSVVAMLLAASLAGCGAQPSGGPADQTVREAPRSQVATDEAHAGAKAVTREVRESVAESLRDYGVSFDDTAALSMAYSADRQQMTVRGGPMRMSETATQSARTVQTVTLSQASGTWRVLNVAGER